MAEAIFNYKGFNTIIQCKENDKLKDIIDEFLTKIKYKENNLYYLYNGTKIDSKLTFIEQANDIDKKRKKMNIVVTQNEEDKNLIKEIASKDIICPECKESSLIDIDNFKINFHDCKNKHNISKTLKEFEETQKINLDNIICDICKKNNKGNTHNNEFYICNTCDINICPLCKTNHDKSHLIINYDEKDYICNKHNELFIKYCKTHNKDICMLCEKEHEGDKITEFTKLLIDNDVLLESMEKLNKSIDNFKYKINIIKEILDRLMNTIELYYRINNNIISNFNINKRNYYLLKNLYNIKNNNEVIIKYIDNMTNNNQIFNIYKFPNDYFLKDNDGIYVGELQNTYIYSIKEGKGIYYYNKDDIINRKMYEGDFKNDKREGKGIFYWINNNRYEGECKNDKREGKGIFYWNDGSRYEGDFMEDLIAGKGKYYYNNGDRYEGECANGKAEGKGVFFWSNGDRFEGEWKNNKKDGKGIMYYNNGKKEEGIWINDHLIKN